MDWYKGESISVWYINAPCRIIIENVTGLASLTLGHHRRARSDSFRGILKTRQESKGPIHNRNGDLKRSWFAHRWPHHPSPLWCGGGGGGVCKHHPSCSIPHSSSHPYVWRMKETFCLLRGGVPCAPQTERIYDDEGRFGTFSTFSVSPSFPSN